MEGFGKAPELPSQLPGPHLRARRCGTRGAHRADRKRNTLRPREKSPEAFQATVMVAAQVRRLIGGATRPKGRNQGHSPRPLGSGRGACGKLARRFRERYDHSEALKKGGTCPTALTRIPL